MLQFVQSITLINQVTIGEGETVKSRSYFLTDLRRNVYTVQDLQKSVPDVQFKFLFVTDITEGISNVDFEIYTVDSVCKENGLIIVDCVYENTYKSELIRQKKGFSSGWMEQPTHDHLFTAPFILTEAYRFHHISSMGIEGVAQ